MNRLAAEPKINQLMQGDYSVLTVSERRNSPIQARCVDFVKHYLTKATHPPSSPPGGALSARQRRAA